MQVTFAALADASRLRIIGLLRGGPQPVSAIADALDLRQPQVSKHLRVLKEAGLVEVEAQAQLRLYRLSPQPLRELQAWLDDFHAQHDERHHQLDAVLQRLQGEASSTVATAAVSPQPAGEAP
jgi:DNA-binding transcriptional ArsR family regulator